ncbi:MAG: hypothetical protein PVF18_13400, partial [Anaerolineales bacterium]
RRGSYYSYGETRLGQGRENSKQFLRENPDIAEEIEHAILQQSGLLAAEDTEQAEVEEPEE